MYNYNSNWYEKDNLSELLNVAPEKIIIFDTETTGFNPYGNDEILQIAIIDGNGNELFKSYIKPDMRKTWTKAAEKNGITPRMVKDAPHFSDVEEEIQNIFNNAEVIIGYNVEFDIRFMDAYGIKIKDNTKIFCVMQEYAVAKGVRNEYYGDYKWSKLEQCARDYNYKFKAHDAYEDAKATLHCYKSLLEDDRYLDIIKQNKEATDRIKAQKAYEEELKRAEEEKKIQKEERKQEIYTKAEKPLNVVKIILLVVGILWIAVITLAGLSAKIGIGYIALFDVPGLVAIFIAFKIKKAKEANDKKRIDIDVR